jgi:prephenate dehydrogenase
MPVQITLVGLGQIGASIGLALAEHKTIVHRVGHDRDLAIARRAEKLGALDKVMFNLPSAVRQADLVLLALPMDQIRETLEIIASDLKEGVVVMDTSPVKAAVVDWATELLPQGRYYVGLTPILNPIYLHEATAGVEAARPDLFRHGMMAIVAPQRTPSEAIKLATDLTRLLGASPYFADPLEIDGLMAATHLLPQLLAVALLDATIPQPGWHEARKVAGGAYAEGSHALLHATPPQSLRTAVLLNPENVLHRLDNAIFALQAMRHEIATNDSKALDERFGRARYSRDEWWKQRQAADWISESRPQAELPTSSEVFGQLLGIGQRKKGR